MQRRQMTCAYWARKLTGMTPSSHVDHGRDLGIARRLCRFLSSIMSRVGGASGQTNPSASGGATHR